ncbi:hypothetical protein ABZ897_43845 [Nonomuraea sp. NPDC046802]|uniref:hypothetical protein n=1 Tax=Nonomuraea sp. NPDC046802 TaxID=3154919 RepID=UPI0033E6B036
MRLPGAEARPPGGGTAPGGGEGPGSGDPRPVGVRQVTLLRTINHLEKIDRGSVRLDGRLLGYRQAGDRLHELPEREVLGQRTQIGFVFQSFNL